MNHLRHLDQHLPYTPHPESSPFFLPHELSHRKPSRQLTPFANGSEAGITHDLAIRFEHEEVRPSEAQGRWVIPLLDLPLTSENSAIALVYFVQGLLDNSILVISYLFKNEMGLEPGKTAFLIGMTDIPWMVKPIYGYMSDTLPLFGYRRRSYLIVAGAVGALSWMVLALGAKTVGGAMFCLCVGSAASAICDVVADSLAVERSRDAPPGTTGSLQSLCQASLSTGGIFSAYLSGSLVKAFGPRRVFMLASGLPLLVVLAACLIDEKPVTYAEVAASYAALLGPKKDSDAEAAPLFNGSGSSRTFPSAEDGQASATRHPGQTEKEVELAALLDRSATGAAASASSTSAHVDSSGAERSDLEKAGLGGPLVKAPTYWERLLASPAAHQAQALWAALRDPRILYPTLFIFLWQATPTSESAMFYYQTEVLHFDAEFLGRVRLVGAVSELIGVLAYNRWLKHVPLRKVFLGTAVAGALIGLTQLLLVTGANRAMGLSDKIFSLGDGMVLKTLGSIAWMPVAVLSARISPPHIEATFFAALMSLYNAGGSVSAALGGALTSALGITSTDFKNIAWLVFICSTSTLLPLPLLKIIPPSVDLDPGEEEGVSPRVMEPEPLGGHERGSDRGGTATPLYGARGGTGGSKEEGMSSSPSPEPGREAAAVVSAGHFEPGLDGGMAADVRIRSRRGSGEIVADGNGFG